MFSLRDLHFVLTVRGVLDVQISNENVTLA